MHLSVLGPSPTTCQAVCVHKPQAREVAHAYSKSGPTFTCRMSIKNKPSTVMISSQLTNAERNHFHSFFIRGITPFAPSTPLWPLDLLPPLDLSMRPLFSSAERAFHQIGASLSNELIRNITICAILLTPSHLYIRASPNNHPTRP